MNALEASGLTFRYEDGTDALNGLDFFAAQGSITGVLGANGAGKSTLLCCLCGALHPSAGEVRVLGEPVRFDRAGVRRLRERVGVVFQNPDDQLFSADVYRDISFGAVNLGLPENEVRARVEQAMEQVGVSALRDRPAHALSFGQKKRVAIAGVLVMRPQIIILDEPTAGLDPQGAADMLRLCAALRDGGTTLLIATHDMEIVPLCCDEVFLLSGGKTAARGTPAALLQDAALLRQNGLRLPRIAHLMEILSTRDGLAVDPSAATIGGARREIVQLVKKI